MYLVRARNQPVRGFNELAGLPRIDMRVAEFRCLDERDHAIRDDIALGRETPDLCLGRGIRRVVARESVRRYLDRPEVPSGFDCSPSQPKTKRPASTARNRGQLEGARFSENSVA